MTAQTWRKLPLRELGHIQAGRQRSPQFTEGTMRPYLRVANVFDGFIDTSDVLTMRFTDAEYRVYRLQHGDILLNEGQSRELVGRSAMYRGEPPDCCFQNTLIRFRAGPEITPEYALAAFQYCMYSGRFVAIAAQTTSVAHLGTSRFADLEILLPPFSEQRLIADILAMWDRAIDLTSQLIAAKQQRKRGLMQLLLTGKKRFREFANASWSLLKASDIFQSSSKRNNGDEELLSVTQERGVIPRKMLDTRVVMPAGETESYKLVEPGDFIISLRSFQGGIEYSEYRGLVSPAYTVLKPKLLIVDSFYKHLFKSRNFISHLGVAIIGIRDGKQINFEDFAAIRLAYPTLEEQKRIAEILDACDDELTLLNRKLALLKKQKQGLMQQLLTGKIRVTT